MADGGAPQRLRAFCQIWLSGKDVTSKFDPHLLSLTVTDKEMATDTARIELDDRYGTLELPAENDPIKIGLGWLKDSTYTVFEGVVADLEHYGSKKQGRRMHVEANAVDMLGLAKQPLKLDWHEQEGQDGKGQGKALEDVFKEAAKAAGFDSSKIASKLGQIKRPTWHMIGESFLSWASRIAEANGGNFEAQMKDGKQIAVMSEKNGTTNPDGQEMPTVDAKAGMKGNLIAWRIKPIVTRSQWKETAAEWFDRSKAKWDSTVGEIQKGEGGWFGNAKPTHTSPVPMGDKDQATNKAKSDAGTSERRRGTGWVVIDGEPKAQAQGSCQVQGVRRGVDGKYRIVEVEHSYNRKGGYICRLELEQPQLSGNLSQDWDVPTGPNR